MSVAQHKECPYLIIIFYTVMTLTVKNLSFYFLKPVANRACLFCNEILFTRTLIRFKTSVKYFLNDASVVVVVVVDVREEIPTNFDIVI